MKTAVLSLGSNLGNRALYMENAAKMVEHDVGRIIKKSPIAETKSWGFCANDFLNQLLVIETDCTPEALLRKTQDIEKMLGRTQKSETDPTTHEPIYHDRTIDIDILFYEDEVRRTPELTLPHPKIMERPFITEPLQALCPEFLTLNSAPHEV